MSFRQKIRHYIVQNFGYTNKQATEIITSGRLRVNGEIITDNIMFDDKFDIYLDNNLLKPKVEFKYIAFYKPRGIETTHNTEIKDNLTTVFNFDKHLSFAGRLDKESEGLLILSDDGKYIQALSSPNIEKEKEYIVTVNKPIVDSFIREMGQGVNISIAHTKPCFIEKLSEFEFRIILTEGKNRQIRRMCKVFGYLVARLIRIRIDNIHLGDLKPGEFREFKI